MSFLKWLWEKWLAIAQPIGNFQSQVLLSVFYIIFVFPMGVGYKLFSDPFKLKGKLKSNFDKWEHPVETLESAHRQY